MTAKRPPKKAPAKAGAVVAATVTFKEVTERGLRIEGILSQDESGVLVKLSDGQEARIGTPLTPDVVTGIPRESPDYLIDWVSKVRANGSYDNRHLDFLERMATEKRMQPFWQWVASRAFTGPGATVFWSSHSIATQIRRATRLPGKPGDMPPAKRKAYFDKVRKHAVALQELLLDTRFDRNIATELSEKRLEQTLDKALYDWGEDEADEGHVVAYQVTPDGRFELSYDYPECALTETLSDLLSWTHWEDQWDGSFFGTSAPIVQVNSETAGVVYLSCVLHDWFKRRGVEIPFPLLATVANVALELPPDEQVDEETVRKQVRRYEARQARGGAEEDSPF